MAKVLRLSGEKEMQRRIEELAKRWPRNQARATRRFAETILTVAKRDFVPVHDGILRDSGHVEEVTADGLELAIVFGGSSAPYAEAVHEHLSEHSPYSWRVAERSGHGVTFHPAGRGPKYLEKPMQIAMATANRVLASDLDLNKGGE